PGPFTCNEPPTCLRAIWPPRRTRKSSLDAFVTIRQPPSPSISLREIPRARIETARPPSGGASHETDFLRLNRRRYAPPRLHSRIVPAPGRAREVHTQGHAPTRPAAQLRGARPGGRAKLPRERTSAATGTRARRDGTLETGDACEALAGCRFA